VPVLHVRPRCLSNMTDERGRPFLCHGLTIPMQFKRKEVTFRSRRLPHWRMEGASFVTRRVHESLGALTFEERDEVVAATRHSGGDRYELTVYVVMDDHVHVIVTPLSGYRLESIAHSWKSFTAHQFQQKFGHRGAVWQHESYDRIIYDREALLSILLYILNNPVRRWPEWKGYPWLWVKEMEDWDSRTQRERSL